jgi:Uma2 family endonuclease
MVQTPLRSFPLLIELPDSVRLQVTYEQFELLAAANRNLRLERTEQGELIVNPPTGWETGERNFSLTGQLYRWYEDHADLGKAFDSSTAFTLPNGAIRSPDASWVSRSRWEALSEKQKTTFAQICPDFVVELRSASDSLRCGSTRKARSLQTKMQEYLNNGAKLGWLIDPQRRQVEVYRPEKEVEILNNPSELSGEDILPEFVFSLHRIWSSSALICTPEVNNYGSICRTN